ncbi:unnamed protein product [Brassica oleracea]
MRKPKSKKKVLVEDEETPPQYEVGGISLFPLLSFFPKSRNLICFIYVDPSSPDLCLPPRLFATDRFTTRRHNTYSSPDLLPFIRNVLRDTPEFETIRRSCFGKLFDLPARQCPVSCKLIHAFLTRQLVCLPKNTLWSAFGDFPFRYGLEEFGTVTGLPCGSYPERYNLKTGKAIVAGKDRVWKRLFGKKKFVTIADLCRMLETDKDMDGWKKIRIALIIIVGGVLIAHKQEARPTPRYVRMVENLKTFLAFPWGRESFLKTISCMKPPSFVPKKCEDPVATLVKTLKQRSFRLQGFPLSLQLVAFRSIPLLLDYIPAPLNNLTLMDLEDGTLPQHKSINVIHIRRVEFDPNDQNAHGVVDLMATKDVESHVPSLEENHLANELSKSPLIPAVTLISPLPGLEWDLFYNTVSTKMDVYHSAPSSFDFSNKFLLDLAKPKQWTSTRARVLSFLIPLNYTQRTYDH